LVKRFVVMRAEYQGEGLLYGFSWGSAGLRSLTLVLGMRTLMQSPAAMARRPSSDQVRQLGQDGVRLRVIGSIVDDNLGYENAMESFV
jgi:hypothetical protein